MSQLTNPEVSPSVVIVTKSCLLISLFLSRNSDFKLMLTPEISNDLPIVDALSQLNVCIHGPKHIVILLKKKRSVITADLNFLRQRLEIPSEVSNNYPHYVSLKLHFFHFPLNFNNAFVFNLPLFFLLLRLNHAFLFLFLCEEFV